MKSFLKKALSLSCAAVMTLTALTACGNSDSNENDGSTDTFKIGSIGPITGENASYGLSVKYGAEVAIDEINAAGGVNGMKLELVYEDDEADPEKAVNAYNKLVDKNINALLGCVTSGSCIAVVEESQKDNILQITPSGSAQDCAKYSNAFRICFTDPLQGTTMAKYISEQGFKKVAVIYDVANEYSKGIRDAFVGAASENKIEIVADESFTSGDVDFKTQLTKVKASGADCIFLPIYYTEVAYISEQAKTVGVELPYFGCDGWDGVIKQLNGDTTNIEGAIFLTPFVATSEEAKVQSFVKAYEAKYGATPDQFAADAYDGVYTIKAAIEAANGDISNEALIAAMTKITVEGITGTMTFTPEGEPNKSAKVAVIQNGQYVAK